MTPADASADASGWVARTAAGDYVHGRGIAERPGGDDCPGRTARRTGDSPVGPRRTPRVSAQP